ncbi:MAG: methyl-accepting chemotaxis protein [Oscillospiraceae bacterium]|nr:methyl-accepting chemotaxis protein [Oscillospiraceae bacterium]
MNWFKNLKIRTKMLLSFGLIIVFLLAIALFAITELQAVDEEYRYTLEHPIEAKMYMLDFRGLQRDLRRVTVSMSAHALINDSAVIDALYQEGLASYEEARKLLDDFEGTLYSDPKISQAEKDGLGAQSAEIRRVFQDYKTTVTDQVYEAARAGRQAESLEIVTANDSIILNLRNKISEVIAIADGVADAETLVAQKSADRIVVLMAIVSAAAALLAFCIALFVARLISSPLLPLSGFMNKAGMTGDIELLPEDVAVIGKYAQCKDEIGRTIAACAAFVGRITDVGKVLDRVSDGDLTAELKLLSERDSIGAALKKMTDNLNDMFAEIDSSSSQVAIGAGQVASGSQALAQGTTEQASAMEQLSSSISEISDKTKQNAKMTEEAVTLSGTIKRGAEKGSSQMDHLMQAVSEITEASNSISKVIKVIDDIAFQTNILALNAAVEAARAGQHGKGFAVVAEEVRNLAAKSADSAKDTSRLIENSIEKSSLGLTMATETAASLREIVSGINQNAGIVSEIARSSEEQSHAVNQINIGIDQVSQVIQQNSATAQESAAVSEQMSGQATMLQTFVKQFKLRESSSGQIRMPEYPRRTLSSSSIEFGMGKY